MEMILLQASLIGENVTDCVIVVNLDDEESSAMTIPIDSYDISEMGSNGDADNDAQPAPKTPRAAAPPPP